MNHLKFITLGPSGSNHEHVTSRYIAFHGLHGRAALELVADFEQGAAAVLDGSADFMVQCAVHPATTATVAKFRLGLFVIDTFISPSQDLAIVQRRDVARPAALAAMRPTLDYIDPGEWERVELVATVAEVTRGLVEGRFGAGLAYASVAATHPGCVRTVQFLGTVDDAWIVYGRERASAARLLAWPESPAAALYRRGA